eukprot:3823595-Rhodomonas_salina.3
MHTVHTIRATKQILVSPCKRKSTLCLTDRFHVHEIVLSHAAMSLVHRLKLPIQQARALHIKGPVLEHQICPFRCAHTVCDRILPLCLPAADDDILILLAAYMLCVSTGHRREGDGPPSAVRGEDQRLAGWQRCNASPERIAVFICRELDGVPGLPRPQLEP